MPLDLESVLSAASIDVDAIASRGGMVWLFGSRASDCAHVSSDWDILIVDTAQRLPTRCLPRHVPVDLVFVSLCAFDQWCGSELASHVGTYGRALSSGCRIPARPTSALPRKRRVIRERASALQRLWQVLQPHRQERELVRLRRDAQRAWHLARELPVPPTAFLDAQWCSMEDLERRRMLDESELSIESRGEWSISGTSVLEGRR